MNTTQDNSQNNYTSSLIVAVIVLLLIAGGAYIYMHKNGVAGQYYSSTATTTATSTASSTSAANSSSSVSAAAGTNWGLVQSISTSTANLKNYTNTDYDFSINYPKAWSSPINTSRATSSLEISVTNAVGTDGFHIQALPASANFGLQNFVVSDWGHASTSKFAAYYVGNKAAVKYDYGSAVADRYIRTIQIGFDTANGSFVSFFYSRMFDTKAQADAANMSEADQLASEIQFY